MAKKRTIKDLVYDAGTIVETATRYSGVTGNLLTLAGRRPFNARKYKSFDEAYGAARRNGSKTFIWNGETYNTDYKSDKETLVEQKQEELDTYGITNEQTRNRNRFENNLVENLIPYGYDDPIKRTLLSGVFGIEDKTVSIDPEIRKVHQDAFNLLLGKPQTSNTFKISEHTPTKGKARDYYFDFVDEDVIGSASKFQLYDETNPATNVYMSPHSQHANVLGNYTYNEGKEYNSYYDKYDIDPFGQGELSVSYELGTPFHIYGREYKNNPKFDARTVQYSNVYKEMMKSQGAKSEFKYGGNITMNKLSKNIGRKKRLALGGTALYGQEITENDIRNSEVNAAGTYASSGGYGTLAGAGAGLAAGLGASALGIGAGIGAGAAAGAAAGSIVPGLGTAIGAVVGLIGGLFAGRRKKKQAKKQLAANRELERQAVIQNAESKLENDAYSARQNAFTDTNNFEGFYRYGGMVGRPKMAQGGTVRNSSDTVVAYGATHEQMNNQTGETGVPYGDAEIEGGGDRNGKLLAGEVVKENGKYGIVFSDKLTVPGGGKRTFADVAKKISDRKGKLEEKGQAIESSITNGLNGLGTPMRNSQRGTSERNLEKAALAYDRNTAKIAELDELENELYATQEQMKEITGIAGDTSVQMKFGGRLGRRRMDYGGLMSFGTFALQGINAWQNKQAIDFESKLVVPRRPNVQAPTYNTSYNLGAQLENINAQSRALEKYVKGNTSNAAVARNHVTNIGIQSARARNEVLTARDQYRTEQQNKNIDVRYQVAQQNAANDYQYAVDVYNKQVDINSKYAASRGQFAQSAVSLLGDIALTKANQYAIGANYLTQASDADTNRLKELYNNTYGTGIGNTWNRFKSLFGRSK